MRHALTIAELPLVTVDVFCLLRNNKVLKCSKCQQMCSSVQILLKDNTITLHMMVYTYFCLYDMKIAMRVFRTLVLLEHHT